MNDTDISAIANKLGQLSPHSQGEWAIYGAFLVSLVVVSAAFGYAIIHLFRRLLEAKDDMKAVIVNNTVALTTYAEAQRHSDGKHEIVLKAVDSIRDELHSLAVQRAMSPREPRT